MDSVVIKNSVLNGVVQLPPSKSVAHRALICAALSKYNCKIGPLGNSDDVRATISVLKELRSNKEFFNLNCNESGSTLRFLIPVAAALGKHAVFNGNGRLPQRPIDDYVRLLTQHGVRCKSQGGLPLEIEGKLQNGIFEIAGDVSSQYVTGLLLALPLCDGDSKIVLTSKLQSLPYVELTIKVMSDFGVLVEKTDFGYFVKGNQEYKCERYFIESDWSQAAFFGAAGAIGGNVAVKGLNIESIQGDKRIVDVLKQFGANVKFENDCLYCSRNELKGITVDASDIPDMVPSIAVIAAYAKGKTVINGTKRLRLKESDRVFSVVSNLQKMGVNVECGNDFIEIEGREKLKGAKLDGFNDHRIVMAFSIAALFADGDSIISDAQSINKSYPDFFKDFNRMGGKSWVQLSEIK